MDEHKASRRILSRQHARPRGGARLCPLLLIVAVTPMWANAHNASRPATSSAPSRPAASMPASAPASPEEGLENIDLLSLEIPTVVTASRREQKINTVPHAMTVITAEDIRAAGAHSVPEALRLAAGVDVAQLSLNTFAVSPRGFHGVLARETLVLVDGRQIFDSLYGGTLWGTWPFQMQDIARIEVIRGPGGVTWGANAVNGVINIITKDPADQLGLTVTGEGGSRGWQKEYVGYGFKDDQFRMRVSGQYKGNDGATKGGSILEKPDDDLRSGSMLIHAICDPGPQDTLTLSLGGSVNSGGLSTAPLTSLISDVGTNARTESVLGRWEHRIAEDNRINVTGYVNDVRESPASRAVDYNYQQLALQVGQTFKPADNHTVTWGVDSRTDLLDTTNSDPMMLTERFVSTAIIGLYAQDEWRLAPRWTVNLGARIDYEFWGGFQPSGRAALSYELSETSMLYGAVSRAFQMPPAGLRHVNVPMVEGLAFVTADRDLGPASLVAYELGYRGRPLERLQISAAFFWSEYDDATIFDTRLGPPGLMRYHITNTYDASLYGAELELEYEMAKNWLLLGNYTHEQIGCYGKGSINKSDSIAPPAHKFMAGTRYSPTQDFHLSAHLYYVDATNSPNPTLPFIRLHVPPYFRLDLRAEHEFWKDRASVAVGVRNLLDSNHFEGASLFQNTTEVPRMVYAEMRVTLK